jgi:hypothetical protein
MVGIRTCGHPVENLKMRRRWWRYYGLRNLLDFEETIFQFPVVLEINMNHMTTQILSLQHVLKSLMMLLGNNVLFVKQQYLFLMAATICRNWHT